MDTPDLIVGKLLPLLRQFCTGPYGIALGGSHAKGSGDALSDVDVYLFASDILPRARRNELVAAALGESAGAASWGSDEPFVEVGTDFKLRGHRVECWLRNTVAVEHDIASCLRGEFRWDRSVWAVMGFFSFVVLGDVHSMHIVEDPQGLLSRWKTEVSTYPEALRRAILDRFMREAAFWPENPHYRSAVERSDVIYTSAIVQQVLHALIQVLFALNRVYFPGEKKLADALVMLPRKPARLGTRVQAMLTEENSLDAQRLREQRRELGELVAEVDRLVRVHGDQAPAPA